MRIMRRGQNGMQVLRKTSCVMEREGREREEVVGKIEGNESEREIERIAMEKQDRKID